MRIAYRTFWIVLLAILASTPSTARALSEPYDHSLWGRFLNKFVNEEGAVNYQAVLADPLLLDTYLLQLATLSLSDLKSWPREERLALWLNVYHAGVIDIIRKHYPVENIQDVSGFWETRSVEVGGRRYSLNQIRSDELIAVFHDEKIHLALACGSKSCPALSREAYTGPRVEGQLFMATRRFVNDPERNRIDLGEKKIRLSRIFKWYAEDFKLDFGTTSRDRKLDMETHAVLSFVHHYLEDVRKIRFLEENQYKVKYLPFDWSLNEWKTAEGDYASPVSS